MLVAAAAIVLGAVVLVSVWVGVGIGRARESQARAGVDPRWVAGVQAFLTDLVAPADSLAAVQDMAVLPKGKRDAATKLLYDAPGAAELRDRRRRIGY